MGLSYSSLLTSINTKNIKISSTPGLLISSGLFISVKHFDKMGCGPSVCLFSEADEKKMFGRRVILDGFSQRKISSINYGFLLLLFFWNHGKVQRS